MSLFLGPIHHIMYGKMVRQEQLSMEICKEFQWSQDQYDKLDKKCGTMAKGKLEDIIDGNQIHGWLSNQIDIVETRFANVVKQCTEQNPEALEVMKKLAFAQGEEVGQEIESKGDCAYYFQMVRNYTLDGMPCDGGLMAEKQEEKEIVFCVDEEMHRKYFEEIGCDVNDFFIIRDAWLQGFFKNKSVVYEQLDRNHFCIKEV